MELWEQQGFGSFRDWRLATEKARRAAKTKAPAAAAPAAAAAPTSPVRSSAVLLPVPRASWQPIQTIEPPSAPNSPLQLEAGLLEGNLQERVLMTPRGSWAHTIEHTSPGGTNRCEEYVSPAGARQLLEERNAWRRNVVAARREGRAAREAARRDAERRGQETQSRTCRLANGEDIELQLKESGSGYSCVCKESKGSTYFYQFERSGQRYVMHGFATAIDAAIACALRDQMRSAEE